MRTSVYAKRKMLIYLAVFIALCIFSLVAGSFAPHDAELVNLLEAKKPPGGKYPMGTGWLGRCIFSRILSGASSSIFASLVIVVLSMLVGCATGLISGYVGGIVDEIADACCRCVSCFSRDRAVHCSSRNAGTGTEKWCAGTGSYRAGRNTPRLIRSYVLSIRQENFVKAARLNGQSGLWSILMHHVFPNAIRPVVVTGTLHLSGAMLSISGLSLRQGFDLPPQNGEACFRRAAV